MQDNCFIYISFVSLSTSLIRVGCSAAKCHKTDPIGCPSIETDCLLNRDLEFSPVTNARETSVERSPSGRYLLPLYGSAEHSDQVIEQRACDRFVCSMNVHASASDASHSHRFSLGVVAPWQAGNRIDQGESRRLSWARRRTCLSVRHSTLAGSRTIRKRNSSAAAVDG